MGKPKTGKEILMREQDWRFRYDNRLARLQEMIERDAPPAIIEMYCQSILATVARGGNRKAIRKWIRYEIHCSWISLICDIKMLYWRMRGYERDCACDIACLGDGPKNHKRPICDCNVELKLFRAEAAREDENFI